MRSEKCSGRRVSWISCSGFCCGCTVDRNPSRTPLNVNFFIVKTWLFATLYTIFLSRESQTSKSLVIDYQEYYNSVFLVLKITRTLYYCTIKHIVRRYTQWTNRTCTDRSLYSVAIWEKNWRKIACCEANSRTLIWSQQSYIFK